jgi:transposase
MCPKCGVRLLIPIWGIKQSGFTMLFEAFVLRLAKEMPISQIADLTDETDTRIWRIIHRHVDAAYVNKMFETVTKIGVDETSSSKGHNYITVFADMDSNEVLW